MAELLTLREAVERFIQTVTRLPWKALPTLFPPPRPTRSCVSRKDLTYA